MRHALEKGVASMIARFLLESRHDAVFAAIARADALPPEEIDELRTETLAHLAKVRDEGAPYADAVAVAVREAAGAIAELSPGLTTAATFAQRTARAAVAHAVHTVAKSAASIPDPPSAPPPPVKEP